MSTDESNTLSRQKAEEVVELVAALLPSPVAERVVITAYTDKLGLTTIRIRVKLVEPTGKAEGAVD